MCCYLGLSRVGLWYSLLLVDVSVEEKHSFVKSRLNYFLFY
jgi:hypothetical protein